LAFPNAGWPGVAHSPFLPRTGVLYCPFEQRPNGRNSPAITVCHSCPRSMLETDTNFAWPSQNLCLTLPPQLHFTVKLASRELPFTRDPCIPNFANFKDWSFFFRLCYRVPKKWYTFLKRRDFGWQLRIFFVRGDHYAYITLRYAVLTNHGFPAPLSSRTNPELPTEILPRWKKGAVSLHMIVHRLPPILVETGTRHVTSPITQMVVKPCVHFGGSSMPCRREYVALGLAIAAAPRYL